jgi:hypothetical protein
MSKTTSLKAATEHLALIIVRVNIKTQFLLTVLPPSSGFSGEKLNSI